jgi:hypothetical protein
MAEAPALVTADSSKALFDLGVLQNVLSYVGPGNYLFMAPVSLLWADLYARLEPQKLTVQEGASKRTIACFPQMTRYSTVFTSPARVQLAHESGLDCNAVAYQRAAGQYADIASLAAAHELGMHYTAPVMAGAAQCNKLAEVQYLRSRSCPWSLALLEMGARSGYLDLVRWCYEHGCPWDNVRLVNRYAAESGNVELMAWALQKSRTRLTEFEMQAAAAKGHTAMCQYLHAQQCPWNYSCTRDAAAGGHIDLLRWLVNIGCSDAPYDLCTAAVKGGSIEVLEYLQQEGFLTSVETLTRLLNMAGRQNKLAAAKWLRYQGAQCRPCI